MAMRTVEFDNEHQRRHFEFFHGMNHPHFGVSVNVEVGGWLDMVRARDLKVTPTIVHLVSRAANDVPELRRRIRGDAVIEHDVVHPTFSVATDIADAFSFCDVAYAPDLEDFVGRAVIRMEEVRGNPVFEDEPGRDDYLFMSPLPWFSFTSVQHAMQYHPHDSVPRISWGRFFHDGGRTMMPLSLQAHHALVDGVHAGQFYRAVEAITAGGRR